jgi:hypothetical protein
MWVRAPSCKRDEITDDNGEGELSQAGRQRNRAEVAHEVQVEPQPDHEQQDGHPDLREKIDLVLGGHPAQHGWPHQDAGHDKSDDQRLAQVHRQRAYHGRSEQQHRKLVIDRFHGGGRGR